MKIQANLEKAVKVISEADVIYVTSGVGIGVDSGLPNFRDTKTFWKTYPQLRVIKQRFKQIATPFWFNENPELAWGFHGYHLNLYRATEPHKGFNDLLRIVQSKGLYFVFTSNVDGQFQKAGFDPRRIAECHGSIHHIQCINNCRKDIWEAKKVRLEVDEKTFLATSPLPTCPTCKSVVRPNIKLFSDVTWNPKRTAKQVHQKQVWLRKIKDTGYKLAIIEIGAGLAVSTVRNESEAIAQQFNGTLIRINPKDYQVPQGQISIPLGAKEALSKLSQMLFNTTSSDA